ncbi:MAG: isoleucine--tRNA ligase [Candidatus Lokiarchaeota archaeon]|nr:isoleucine--tRNA ligase [Candidatus Lokiarchaeota archaeon]
MGDLTHKPPASKAPSFKPQYLKELDGEKSFVLPEKELEVLKWWRDNKIYADLKEREKTWPEFRFIDGPPYTTGAIHIGTAWNKVLKDIIIRYKRMNGFRVTDTPGYDTHGLPIEVQMEKQLKTKNKKDIIEKVGMDTFIDSCKKFALDNMHTMNDQFRRLGCAFWNWDRPSVTLTEGYMAGAWWMIKKAHERGLLFMGHRPLNTCPRCETALAKHEFEYMNRKDTSIFIKFKVIGKENEHLVIWTTTPWTLVSNIAVMANPELKYVRVKVKGEIWIMAEARHAMFIQAEIGEFPEVIGSFLGEELKGTRYVHPLLDEVPKQQEFAKQFPKAHTVILSKEFVSAEEGTGLVHCAPGHGPEDYQVGHVEEKLPAFSPLDEQGIYTKDGGIFAGKYVFDANSEIIALLKKKGTLLVESVIDHEYAHCWRCKTPLVYRVLDQWYLKTGGALADRMLAENEKINWVPNFAGGKTFYQWLKGLQDWCISRQRFWGIPLPIWTCNSKGCDNIVVPGSRAELEQLSGQKVTDLHRPWVDKVTFKCTKCKKGTMKRVDDVVDVWLDSGCVMWASNEAVYGDDYTLGPKEYDAWRPADFILEGKDQIRGWFNSLMSCGILSSDRPTYKNVVMHGFVTYEGEPMHKSRGNVVSPEEAIARRGAETFRMYCTLNMSMGEDLNFFWRDYDDTYRIINTLWNCYVYAKDVLSLNGFKPRAKDLATLLKKDKNVEDRWIASRLHTAIKSMVASLDAYDMARYAKTLRDLIIDDVSKGYLKLVKERLSEDAEEKDKVNAMETMFLVLRALNLVMAPIFPVLAELVHKDFMGKYLASPAMSIHLDAWPKAQASLIDGKLETDFDVIAKVLETTRMMRESAGLKLKWPCKELVLAGDEKLKGLEYLVGILEKEANVKQVTFATSFSPGPDHLAGEANGVKIYIDKAMDEGLLAEKFYRDFFRQLQFMRKAAKLNVGDMIDLEVRTSSALVKGHLARFVDDMKKNAYLSDVRLTTKNELQGVEFEQELKYCPEATCLVPLKAKTIENAVKAGKKVVTCSYCSGEQAIENLIPIGIRLKKHAT